MTPEITVPAEGLVALVALVGLMVGVGEQVGLEVGPLVEAPLADGALVRGLLHVEDLVHGKGARLAEALATDFTLEGLLIGMDVSVVP